MKNFGRNSSIFQRRVWLGIIILLMIAGFLLFRYMTGNLDPRKAGMGAEAYAHTVVEVSNQKSTCDLRMISAMKKNYSASAKAAREYQQVLFQEVQTPNIDPTAWNLLLVNPWNYLPKDFSVKLKTLGSGHKVDERIAWDLQRMMGDAQKAGLKPMIISSYRTMEKQTSLYNNQVARYVNQGYGKEEAKRLAAQWVAIPGTSEHQAGLAVDIVSRNYQQLNKKQEETAEQKWLIQNSYKYGFILRYPNGRTDITGIGYEPWHYRYVGMEAAKYIFENDITLEEYLQLASVDK